MKRTSGTMQDESVEYTLCTSDSESVLVAWVSRISLDIAIRGSVGSGATSGLLKADGLL